MHSQMRLSKTLPSRYSEDDDNDNNDDDGPEHNRPSNDFHHQDIESTGENLQLDDDATEPRRPQKMSIAGFTSLPHPIPFHHHRDKVVGLKDAATLSSARFQRQEFLRKQNSSTDTLAGPIGSTTIEDKEKLARKGEITNPLSILYLGNLAAFKVMIFYLITAETILTCMLTAGMIIYWYDYGLEHKNGIRPWAGNGMDFVVLAFAVTSPIAAAIGMAFSRREYSLVMVAEMRSSAHHLYLAHALWDWTENGGRAGCKDFDFLEHCDAVLAQLVGIGDELSRFLTLPTTSRSRHRMTKGGRREAARTIDVAYRLLESMLTQRMTRLAIYAERIKSVGLPSGEISRIRQYERYLHTSIERLRMYKMYRTPQALRSFARIFTLLLPPFYAPKFAQVAIDVHSLGVGLSFGLITAIGLTALFESLQVLEDPFVGFLALDGIDVKEEFEVLLWTSLVKTRRMIFPDAPNYPTVRRGALNVADHGDQPPTVKPSVIQIVARPSLPPRGASVATSARFDPVHHSPSLASGSENQPTGNPLEPTSSELSFLSLQSNYRGDHGIYGGEDDEDAAEFGYPILEDPDMEGSLRQTNFRQDGEMAHHIKHKSNTSTANLMGLVFRGNAAGAGGLSRAPSTRSNWSPSKK